jgi:hypothetical protein
LLFNPYVRTRLVQAYYWSQKVIDQIYFQFFLDNVFMAIVLVLCAKSINFRG